MFLDLLLSIFAAIGLMSVLWAVLGGLLPVCREGWLLYPGRSGKLNFVPVYLWLRSLGLVRCPLILVDLGLSDGERQRLESREIRVMSPEEIAQRLTIGAEIN